MMHDGFGSGMGYGMGWFGFGWLFQIAIFILFFVIIWWIIRNSSSFGFRTGEAAAEILKKRLASGEIDIKEYERLKKEIEK
ncbi:SHOCT domain-containing protein [Candidatus Woesearchaeota archaeon]|nr:SHOCT domain-containing protein [Candidatus Woesearchaeota archaeon]